MKRDKISEIMGQINLQYVEEATVYSGKKKKTGFLHRWGALAACLTAVVIAAALLLGGWYGVLLLKQPAGRYKDLTISSASVGIIWPWGYRTVSEKYTELTIDDVEYQIRGVGGDDLLLGERLGSYPVRGYDEIDEKQYAEEFEVYRLQGAAQSQFVAVKMEEQFHIFKNSEYDPPKTLGELMELVNLPELITLERFSEESDGPEGEHYRLQEDAYIWEVLADCGKAPFVEDPHWHIFERDYLSFTVTSDTLGVYKNAMYITGDGYLWTNAFSWQYLFYIGEEAAEAIIRYAEESALKAEYEPYQNSIVGRVTGITEEVLYVDDSELCRKPEDGIVYQVGMENLRISRYVDNGMIKTGDFVRIAFSGEVDAENGNRIDSALYADKVKISGENVVIPE